MHVSMRELKNGDPANVNHRYEPIWVLCCVAAILYHYSLLANTLPPPPPHLPLASE